MPPLLANPAFWSLTQGRVLVLLLVITRMSGMLATIPGFSQTRLPVTVRAVLALLMSLVISPVLPAPKALPEGMWDLTGFLATELAAGLLMGLAVSWIVETVTFAGQLMDAQMGFSFVQFLDPVSAHPASISGSLLTQVTLLFILVSGLHHQMILAMVESYRILPMGGSLPMKPLELVAQMGLILSRGFQLAFPVLLTLFLVDVMEGIAAKFMPQLQLIQLSFPIKIAVGMAVLAFVLRELGAFLGPLLEEAPRQALRLLS